MLKISLLFKNFSNLRNIKGIVFKCLIVFKCFPICISVPLLNVIGLQSTTLLKVNYFTG